MPQRTLHFLGGAGDVAGSVIMLGKPLGDIIEAEPTGSGRRGALDPNNLGPSNLPAIVEAGSRLPRTLGSAPWMKAASIEGGVIVGARPLAAAGGLAPAEAVLAGLDHWLRTAALPVWWAHGADHAGWGFHETLDLRGRPGTDERRARVQARQAYVYARAGRLGWQGPWALAVPKALDALETVFRRPDNLYRRLADKKGATIDDSALLYDQAFVLLALSEAARVSPDNRRLIARAETIRVAIDRYRWPAGGFREVAGHPFQANCHLHLFEACLAWLTIDGADPAPWRRLAQDIADLAVARFIDPRSGALREFFDEAWNAAEDLSDGNVEPGHQFEWAWLMGRWRDFGGHVAPALIRGLYRAGRAGLDPRRGAVVNRMTEAFHVVDGDSRLWPQTEWLRAAAMMWRTFRDETYAADVAMAGRVVSRFLAGPASGLWRDVLKQDGEFVVEAAPASSLYHLICFLARDDRRRAGPRRCDLEHDFDF